MQPSGIECSEVRQRAASRSRPARGSGKRWALALGVFAACAALANACHVPESERLSCDDVYPPGQFDYRAMEQLMSGTEIGGKGCLPGPCHTAQTQRGGVRLDSRNLIYDELSTRPDEFYATLASGWMPHDGEPWSDEELKIFRSWYCAGAFPP